MTHNNSARLRAALISARGAAEEIGPIHDLWDLIFDAERMLQGLRTIVDWDVEDLIRELERHG